VGHAGGGFDSNRGGRGKAKSKVTHENQGQIQGRDDLKTSSRPAQVMKGPKSPQNINTQRKQGVRHGKPLSSPKGRTGNKKSFRKKGSRRLEIYKRTIGKPPLEENLIQKENSGPNTSLGRAGRISEREEQYLAVIRSKRAQGGKLSPGIHLQRAARATTSEDRDGWGSGLL